MALQISVMLWGGMFVPCRPRCPRRIYQQVRDDRRQGSTYPRVVVVRPEVDRLLVDVGQHFAGDGAHARFGVALGRRWIAVHRPEVTLPVHERVAQREVLRHARQRVVHGGGAVRVVVGGHVAGDLRRLAVRTVDVQVEIVHRRQDPPVHRLEPVAHVRQGARDDHVME
jgi:hypothetical protein